MTSTDPMAGPHMTATRITDSSDMPGYAIRPRLFPRTEVDVVADTLSRLGMTRETDDQPKAA